MPADITALIVLVLVAAVTWFVLGLVEMEQRLKVGLTLLVIVLVVMAHGWFR